MGYGALAALAFDDRDLLAVRRRAGERRVDRAFGRLRNAGDDRQVAPVDAVGGELLGQPLMGDVVLGDDQQARRILVDPVDDPGPRHAADAATGSAAMMEQRVDQRPVAVAGGGMDDQPGGLVDHQQMLVLEDDRQRDVLRLVMGRLRLGDRQREALVAVDLRSPGRGPAPAVAIQRAAWISAFSRSRDKVGTASASARSSRQPAWPASSAMSMTYAPRPLIRYGILLLDFQWAANLLQVKLSRSFTRP